MLSHDAHLIIIILALVTYLRHPLVSRNTKFGICDASQSAVSAYSVWHVEMLLRDTHVVIIMFRCVNYLCGPIPSRNTELRTCEASETAASAS